MRNLEKDLELNDLEEPAELQMNTVTQHVTKSKLEKPKPTCHNCKKPSHYRAQCRQLRRQKDQKEGNKNNTSNKNNNNNSGKKNSNPNNENAKKLAKPMKQTMVTRRNQELSNHPVKPAT